MRAKRASRASALSSTTSAPRTKSSSRVSPSNGSGSSGRSSSPTPATVALRGTGARGQVSGGWCERGQAGDPVVVGPEVADEHADGAVDVERAGPRHLLEVGPVLGAVEERLEHRQVGAGEERELVAAEVLPAGPRRRLLVELGGVEEDVDRGAVPPQAHL